VALLEECTSTIIAEVEGLRRLVEEFSRFARMPSLAPRPTDLARLAEGVVTLYAETHPAVSVRAELAGDLPVAEVDGDQLKRVLLNLLDNALEAGAREVVVSAGLAGPGRVRLAVADDGPGVAAEARDRVFQPYFSTKATGTGLGLAIVHQIVTDHGGQVRVEPNLPRGSRFVLELPLLAGAARPAAAAPVAEGAPA
jgi:two-component system nitrogen regulation sensor histidine kinase NtrY